MLTRPPSKQIKKYIRHVYGRLAASGTSNISGSPIAGGADLARSLGYNTAESPIPEKAWDLFAGCGNPLEGIDVETDWTVLDLGCGVGIDCQMAALPLRPPGKAIGLDITEKLLQLARTYSLANPGLRCHWVLADGEHLPLKSNSVNLALANGAFNLMPSKKRAMSEIHRVLKPGGQLAVTDLLKVGEMEPITNGWDDAWVWCVAGALTPSEFVALMKLTGFSKWQTNIKSTYGPLAAAQVVASKGK
jgi:SAM-dependent methyltransferase